MFDGEEKGRREANSTSSGRKRVEESVNRYYY